MSISHPSRWTREKEEIKSTNSQLAADRRKYIMAYQIDQLKCIGCGVCEHECFFKAVSVIDSSGLYEIAQELCVSCGQCADACPMSAISSNDPEYKRIVDIWIDQEKCIGCSLCQRNCPVDAVDGIQKQPFSINKSRCLRCGVCASKCKKDAIIITY